MRNFINFKMHANPDPPVVVLTIDKKTDIYPVVMEYFGITGIEYNVERWMKIEKQMPINLYFLFKNNTEYGKFMRFLAKEHSDLLKSHQKHAL